MTHLVPDGAGSDLTPNEEVYNNYLGFYKGLSSKGKQEFNRRVRTFIRRKKFDFEFDAGDSKQSILKMIAAACIMVTWGLKDKYLSAYKYIKVYPGAFAIKASDHSKYNTVWFKDWTSFGWDPNEKKILFTHIGKPIGLKEWAAALILQARKDNIYDDFFSAYYKVWCESARDLIFVVNEEDQLPLDAFGKRLPVIIQLFFEEPEELQQNHPELYEETKRLLNLDLIEAKDFDYNYADLIKHQRKLRTSNRVKLFGVQKRIRKFAPVQQINYFIFFLFWLHIVVWFLVGRWTYSSYVFWSLFIGLSTVGLFGVYKRFYKSRGATIRSSAITLFGGVIPLIYSVLVLINFMIPIRRTEVEIPFSLRENLSLYAPWKGFTHPYVDEIVVTRKEDGDFDEYEYQRKLDQVNRLKSKGRQIDIINLMDDNDKIFFKYKYGILNTRVFDGVKVVINI